MLMENELVLVDVPNCPLCGTRGEPLFDEGVPDRLHDIPGLWQHARCPSCGLIWLNPRPVETDIGRLYPKTYFTHHEIHPLSLGSSSFKQAIRGAVLSRFYGYHHLEPRERRAAVVGRLIMFLPSFRLKAMLGMDALWIPYQENGRLLDVGCGSGRYLALMKELGWEVAGIEIDSAAAEIARSHFGIPVHVGTLYDAPFEPESFDAVVMIHVIEHVPDPVEFVRQAAHFLKPGGRMVLVTPNAKSLGARLFKKDWFPLEIPRHLVLFTPETLQLCLAQTGNFEKIVVSTPSRKARKMFYKFIVVRRTGRYQHPMEETLGRNRWIRWKAKGFGWLEMLGNPIWSWGEEIECIAIKN